jgi:hypothetical protein
MGTSLSALGKQGLTLQHGGKTYSCSHLTLEKKAEFETWLKQSVLDALRQMFTRGVFSSTDYDAERRRILMEMATGKFGFYGEAAREAMATEAGALRLAGILFDASDEEMFRLMSVCQDKVKSMMDLALMESQPKNTLTPSEEVPPVAVAETVSMANEPPSTSKE